MLKLYGIDGHSQYRHHGGFPKGYEPPNPFVIIYKRTNNSEGRRHFKTAEGLFKGALKLCQQSHGR